MPKNVQTYDVHVSVRVSSIDLAKVLAFLEIKFPQNATPTKSDLINTCIGFLADKADSTGLIPQELNRRESALHFLELRKINVMSDKTAKRRQLRNLLDEDRKLQAEPAPVKETQKATGPIIDASDLPSDVLNLTPEQKKEFGKIKARMLGIPTIEPPIKDPLPDLSREQPPEDKA